MKSPLKPSRNVSPEVASDIPALATAPMICGWKSKAVIPAMRAAMNKVTIAETFLTIKKAVMTGTSRSQGEILNEDFRSLAISAT